MKRVVVTGVGAVTGMGNSMKATWDSAVQGISGIGELTRFDTSGFSAKTAAEVRDFRLSDYVKVNDRHRMDRFAQYAIASSVMAVQDAGIQIGMDVESERIGVWFGTAIGGIESFEESFKSLQEGGVQELVSLCNNNGDIQHGIKSGLYCAAGKRSEQLHGFILCIRCKRSGRRNEGHTAGGG